MKNLSNQLNIRLLSVLLIALGLVVMLVLSFSLDGAAGSLIPPQIVAKYPQNGSHDAEVTTFISATYDQDMDPATVNQQTFAVHARQTGWLTETLSVEGGMIKLQPVDALHAGELVQVSATTATLSLDGEAPLAPTVWEFTTAPRGGNGYFHENQVLPNANGRFATLGDIDQDGDLDAIGVSCEGFTRVYQNQGNASFIEIQSFPQTDDCLLDVDLGDLDGDGDLDAFLTDYDVAMNFILTNDGTGHFSALAAFPSHNDGYTGLGDLDGDGDLDLFIASGAFNPGELRVWLNDGSANFSLADTFDTGYEHTGLALGDLDNDGDLDAFTTGWYDTYNKVWLNDGSGSFSEAQVMLDANTYYPLLGDLDGDGDLDVYLNNAIFEADYPDEVWLNDGYGQFTNTSQALETVEAAISALGDLDADGDLDVYASGGWETPHPDEVWANDGTGMFSLFRRVEENHSGGMVTLGDLEGDGNLDAFVTSQFELDGYQIYLNGDWTRVADTPEELYAYAFAQCPDEPGKLYVLRGQPFVYDVENDVWLDLAAAPVGWWWSSAVCYQGKIYLAGGEYYGGQDDFSIYDINSDSWITGPDIPRPAVGAILTAWNGKLYLVGGAPDGNLDPVNQVDIYDIATNTWTADALPHLPVATANPGYAQVGPYLYLAGGCSGDFNHNVTATQRFDLSHPEGKWQLGPEFTSARCAPVIAATALHLYAYGGDEDGGWLIESTDLVEVLDLSDWPLGSWQNLNDPLPKPSQGNFSNACTELKAGGEIWSIGGANASVNPYEYLDTTLYYPAEPCVSFGASLPEPMQGEGAAGETVTYTLSITNTGVVTDYYTLEVTTTWNINISKADLGPIGPGESLQFQVKIDIPVEAVWGNQGLSELVVASISNPAAIDNTTITTTSTTVWTRMLIPLVKKN